jgi:HEAT repeat protein
VEQHGQEMGDRLMPILTRLQGEKINEIFFKMCQNPSSKVRSKAINELMKRDPDCIQKLFPLIDDPSREIRVCILAAVAKKRSSILESLLLNYLQENFDPKDPTHLIACYKALGCCGSTAAIPFLRKILLNRGWNSFMGSGKPVFREGAAIALALLNIPEAETVLKKASKSRFKVIRKAFDETKTRSKLFTGNPHD